MPSPLGHILTFCGLAAIAAAAPHAQQTSGPRELPGARPATAAARQFVPNQFLVLFERRSFDLSRYRAAIYARRPAAEVARIVAEMEDAVRRDQADFVRAVRARGGKILSQWWIVNGAAVEIDARHENWLRALPGVRSVHRNPIYHAVNRDARNAVHHNADAANLQRTKTGALIDGAGVSVAILDTGVDANMGGSGRPHRGYFVNGDPTNKTGGGLGGSRLLAALGTSNYGSEDFHNHGTHVSGSVANAWSAYRGMAPGAGLVGIKISNDWGSAAGNWIISAWQVVARDRAKYRIGVANNSFSGSPSLNDPVQIALDSAAYNADVLVVVAAGNTGSSSARSQNAWNGLAVGSVNKFSLSLSSFSSRGPLGGPGGRYYPDLSAVGAGVVSLLRDSESNLLRSSGTSMAAPMVAGAGALVRQVDPRMTAREAKALILNNVKGSVSRNWHGEGILECNLAVKAALAHDYRTAKVLASPGVWNATFQARAAHQTAITVAWMRNGSAPPDNLDIAVYDANGRQVAKDGNPANSYERVVLTPSSSGAYRLEVKWINPPPGGGAVEFAVAGIGPGAPAKPPVLTGISPAAVTSWAPAEVTLTGSNLATIDQVTIGTTPAPKFRVVNATTVKFTPPSPFAIGTHPVTVRNRAGTSGPLNLGVTGNHPSVLRGPAIAIRGFPSSPFEIHTDKNWQAVIFLSTSNSPSAVRNVVSLGIGANFTRLWELTTLTGGADGHAKFPITWPKNMLNPPLWFQAVTFDPNNPRLPVETSNVVKTTLF